MRSARLLTAMLASAAPWACMGGNSELSREVVGPEGATLAAVGGSGALDGFVLEIPAGALDQPTTFTLTEVEEPPALPALPPGFAAFNPMLRVEAEPASSSRMRLHFPIAGGPTDQDVLLSAFYYDDAQARWVMVLPKAIRETEFVIETTRLGYWRWGLTLLDTANGESLEPTMLEVFGETIWHALKAGVEQEFEDTITPEVFNPDNWSNCDKLLLLNQFLVDMAEGASLSLKEALSTACGGCEVTVEEFMDELEDYLRARVQNFIVGLIIESCDLGFLLELVIKLNVALHYQKVIDELSCDYECLLETSPPGLWGSLATYYIAVIADALVYLGYLYDGCGQGD